MEKKFRAESGQILIVFVVALVAMLGFTVLAIDGGMLYSDRRFSQSASDASSMSGAGAAAQYLEANGITFSHFTCANPYVVESINRGYTAAINRATTNQIPALERGSLAHKHGVEITCVFDPAHPFEKRIEVRTVVSSKVSTSFLHFFYSGPVVNTVTSTVTIHPRTELAFGYAIVSTSSDCGNNAGGILFDGSNIVHVNGGGVFSNSCLTPNGGVEVSVTDGTIASFDPPPDNSQHVFNPDPIQSPDKMPQQDVSFPTCAGGAAGSSNSGGTISAGNYSKIKLTNGDDPLTMQAGLYCLSGDMDISGSTLNGDGVTIVLLSGASVTITGGATIHLNAPTKENVTGGAKVGYLFMTNQDVALDLEGNSGSSFGGIVYAPKGKIDVGGTSGVNPTYNTQLVGNDVKVHGNAEININYSDFQPYTEEPKLDMMD